MTSYLLTKNTPCLRVQEAGGNKGRYLFELSALGLPVPSWTIIAADAFRDHCRSSGIDVAVAKLLKDFDPDQAEETSRQVGQLITASTLSEAVVRDVTAALASLGDVLLAVRSSGLEEDGNALSFAGQFDTFLGVRGVEATCDAVKRCWASAYSARALQYRHKHGVQSGGVGLGVVIQELVEPSVSGVAFTVNPANGNPFETVISAVYGLGEGLVSGAVDADVIIVDKHAGTVKNTVIGGKEQRYGAAGITEVAADEQAKCCLSDPEVESLRRLALRIESAFGRPQDIEWCIRDGKVWVLQARPVTALKLPIAPGFDVWDNSNIIENYPGITSQLTFTFARHLYGKVFLEYCKLLKIPPRHLREMEPFLDGLLGHVNGRVYYNLLHWYKLVGVNPFQKLGRQMMEVQMGVAEALDLDAAVERIKPYHPRSRAELLGIRAVSGSRFFSMFFRSEKHVRVFKKGFHELFTRFDAIAYDTLPPEVVFAHYKSFERGILSIWGITVSLESAIGLPYGLLRALLKRWIPDAPPWLEAGVIGGVEGVESLEPARRMEALAKVVRQYPGAEVLIKTGDPDSLLPKLRSEYPEVGAVADAYIRDFGYRAHNELKLEEPDMHESPGVLFEMLRVVLASKSNNHAENASSGQEQVEQILRARLDPAQVAVLKVVRGLVRGAIRRRETVRFCRSRTFGLFRKMFLAMGRGLAQYGVLEEPRDVFHLRREELDGCFDASVSNRNLKQLVAQRKADAQAFAEAPEPPARFISRGPIAGWLAWVEADNSVERHGPESAVAGELRGTACSPGRVEGVASVVRQPTEFTDGILVTYRTDPGWIAVFPSAQALLVERGSPLTHAAIVARELGLPTIVQIPGLTRHVASGMRLRVDADQGRIFTEQAAATWSATNAASA